MTQLLVDDLLVYNGTAKMASSTVNCHTIVFTDVTDFIPPNNTAAMYVLCFFAF